MNLGELLTTCYMKLGFESSPGTPVTARLTQFLNDSQREILRDKHFSIFRRQLMQASSVANTPFMGIPRSIVRIYGLQDRTNNLNLTEKDMLWIRSTDPALRATAANPWVYARYNMFSPTIRQPAAAGEIWAKSTSAADTVIQVVIEGFRSNGGYFTTTSTVNGTTGQRLGAITDILTITKFYVHSAGLSMQGDVSIYEGSTLTAANVLATIPSTGAPNLNTLSRYTLLHLYPIPSAVVAYYVDAEVHISDLVDAFDEPLLPEDFSELLVIGVKKREYEIREKMDKQWASAKAEWAEERRKMVNFVSRTSGLQNQTGYQGRYSQLGPWFPSGT